MSPRLLDPAEVLAEAMATLDPTQPHTDRAEARAILAALPEGWRLTNEPTIPDAFTYRYERDALARELRDLRNTLAAAEVDGDKA